MATKKFVNLLQRHEPPMDAGVYQITVNQTLTAGSLDTQEPIAEVVKKKFYVFGERFTMGPDAIHSVYPPAGSKGDHSATFPHIIFNRSTLPWERSILSGKQDIWLALLLFDEVETPKTKVVPLNQEFYRTVGNATSEPGDGLPEAPISVIDVSQKVLEKIIPQRSDLEYAAHSRREGKGETNDNGRIIKSTFRTTEPERAVIIGNRLPTQGQLSTVHLVSLENRFKDGKFDYSFKTTEGNIRLVSLKSWSFTSVEPRYNFKGMLKGLDRSPSSLALPYEGMPDGVQALLSKGFLAIPHLFRKGAKAVSWYRGPLSVRTPDDGPLKKILPAASADKLLVFDKTNGMFDTSYAAAWQLGRLMALEDRKFSLDLYQLKRRMSLDSKRKKQNSLRLHLKLGNDKHMEGIDEVKKRILAWMRRSYRLEQVPFHYLVPHTDMLPPESIRFFEVDPTWVRCLNDGAASIGRTSSDDIQLDMGIDLAGMVEDEQLHETKKLTGFLLRSELVAGYPGLQIAGFLESLKDSDESEDKQPLTLLRRELLSDNVLLCIFKGEVNTLEFFQKPDVLHFGIDRENGVLKKQFRYANGEDMPDDKDIYELELQDEKYWYDEAHCVANFKTIATELQNKLLTPGFLPPIDQDEFKDFTSADFALQMLEGVEMVRFTRWIPEPKPPIGSA